MHTADNSSLSPDDPPGRRARRVLTRHVLAAVADAVAGRATPGEATALIVANAEVYAALLSELEGHPRVAATALDRASAP